MAGTRTTELQAVNTMLSAVGEPPINNLEGNKNADAAIARNILTEISREIQAMGWHFNSQNKVKFTPDSSSKEIALAENIVRVDLDDTLNNTSTSTDQRDITQRGPKLFDRTNNTYEFTKDVTARVVYVLDWDELPEPVRRYVTVKSARVFQDRMVGSERHHSFSKEDEVRAFALLKEFEGETSDTSIFDNYDVYRIVARHDTTGRII
jgi:hypothetical protein|tara:strand:+ start:2904 stop:3527 length:624 start_codon:yes stop_codon:yes gene_type:complete